MFYWIYFLITSVFLSTSISSILRSLAIVPSFYLSETLYICYGYNVQNAQLHLIEKQKKNHICFIFLDVEVVIIFLYLNIKNKSYIYPFSFKFWFFFCHLCVDSVFCSRMSFTIFYNTCLLVKNYFSFEYLMKHLSFPFVFEIYFYS